MEQQLSMYTSTCICSIISVNIRISGFMTQVLLICVFTDTARYNTPVVDSSASHTHRLYQYIYIYIYTYIYSIWDQGIPTYVGKSNHICTSITLGHAFFISRIPLTERYILSGYREINLQVIPIQNLI